MPLLSLNQFVFRSSLGDRRASLDFPAMRVFPHSLSSKLMSKSANDNHETEHEQVGRGSGARWWRGACACHTSAIVRIASLRRTCASAVRVQQARVMLQSINEWSFDVVALDNLVVRAPHITDDMRRVRRAASCCAQLRRTSSASRTIGTNFVEGEL